MQNVNLVRNKRAAQYFFKDNGIFPNSILPVLHYKQVLDLPLLFPAHSVKRMFEKKGWTNNWKGGIYNYHHYHSNAHEAMAVINGETLLQLGGENGTVLSIKKGDLILIPAGVAHKNILNEDVVTCIGGYPEGKHFDMNYGKPGERPAADKNIVAVDIPPAGPIPGVADPMLSIWLYAKIFPE